ncbi:uncharacterized protein LOC103513962 [Diaphorina citri]|uniref:Uncharacterized protein LOC103513962 n=1 Tax=Diaphorina citri TaxID=121845 RepID=A0A3Q0J2Y3_DIACI|nr:uncharacterized protein LOC103513962 [Diaphorina citri]
MEIRESGHNTAEGLAILAIGLAFSVIYTAVVFIIAGEVFGDMFWIVGGLLTVASPYTAVVFIIAGEVFGGMFWIVGGLLTVGIYVYMWLVVYSYYQLLREEADRGPYSKPAYRR